LQLLVGLGNPGKAYQFTRHNLGFRFLDAVAARCGVSFRQEARFEAMLARARIAGRDLWLAKPLTFMNESGRAVAAIARFYKLPPEAIFVAYDDLDLPAGKFRIRLGGGHGGHNGVRSIAERLGSASFVRLKFGIGRPPAGWQATDWVLGRADQEELAREARLFSEVIDELGVILAGEFSAAAGRIGLRMQAQ